MSKWTLTYYSHRYDHMTIVMPPNKIIFYWCITGKINVRHKPIRWPGHPSFKFACRPVASYFTGW